MTWTSTYKKSWETSSSPVSEQKQLLISDLLIAYHTAKFFNIVTQSLET